MNDELSALENNMVDVILEAKRRRFSVSSEFARANAAVVAMAASMNAITTKVHKNVFGHNWMPTALGLTLLEEVELEGELND